MNRTVMAFAVVFFSIQSLAVDLDWEGAQQKYEAKQKITDQIAWEVDEKSGIVDTKTAELNREKERLQNAQRSVFQLQADINALMQQEANLKVRLSSIQNEIPNKQRERQRLEGEADSLSRQLQNEKATLDNLQRELQRLQGEKAQKESSIQSDLNQIARLENEIPQLKNRLNQAQAQLQNFRARVQAARQEKQDSRQKLNALQARLAQLRPEIGHVENQVAGVQQELDRSRARSKELADRIRDLKAQLNGGDGDAAIKTQIEQLQFAKGQEDAQGDSLKAELQNQKQRLNALEKEEQQTKNQIAKLKARIDSLDTEIASLETQIQTAQNEVQTVKQSIATSENQLNQLQAKVGPIQQDIQTLTQQIRGVQGQVQAQKNSVATLQQRLNTTQDALRSVTQALAQLERDRLDIQRRLNQIPGELQNHNFALSQAENEVRRLEIAVRDAEFVLSQSIADYESALRRYRVAKAESDAAYSYYEQVVANYNLEKDKVVRLASAAGATDGGVEGRDSGAKAGSADGKRVGQQAGSAKGSDDGSKRDFLAGYQEGRANPSLAATFAQGTTEGTNLATQKAKAEDFPKGYNTYLDTLLGDAPQSDALVDMTEMEVVPSAETGMFLKPEKKAIGSVGGPGFSNPKGPAFGAPTSGALAGVMVPVPSHTHYNAPCTNLILPEFGPLCEDVYHRSYLKNFESVFDSTYRGNYPVAYNQSASQAYQTALAQQNGESHKRGLSQGGLEQARSDAFATSLPSAKQEQHRLGGVAVEELLKKGYMVFFRKVELQDVNGDGLLSPGEDATLKVVVDNYGKLPTPDARFVVRVVKAGGISGLIAMRALPALATDSRTTFEGVLSGKISQTVAGGKIQVVVRAETDKGEALSELSTEAAARFPLELTAFTLEKAPAIGETVQARITFKNQTRDTLPDTTMSLTHPEQLIEILDPQVALPSLASGESATVAVRVKPTAGVGGNRPVEFVSTIEGLPSIERLVQMYSLELKINRKASLDLFDASGVALSGGYLNVRAGTTLKVIARFAFHSNKSEPGPYKIGKAGASSTSIKNTNNSTVSVTLGSASPSSNGHKVTFSYDIGRDLAGQKGWVLLNLSEGSKVIHAPRLWLNIQ